MARVVIDEGWTADLDVDIARMLNTFGQNIRDDAKVGCPVDSGDLKESIHDELQDDGRSVRIIADAKAKGADGKRLDYTYAGYVEEGTSKIHPEPYLRPALLVQRSL